MPRLFQLVLFGLILPALLTALLFGLAGGLWQASPLIQDLLAEGADRVELFTIIMEEVMDEALKAFLFTAVAAAPALAFLGLPALFLVRKPWALIATGAAGGFLWAGFVDYYDSFFTGPGVEWDWPLGGAAFGTLTALLAISFLRRRWS